MLSLLRKLKSRIHLSRRSLILSIVCVAAVVSSSLFVGATTFACKVEIIDDGKLVNTILTNETNSDEILDNQGIKVSKYDEVIFTKSSDKTASIKINRAFGVTLEADSDSVTVQMVRGTVQDALDEADITVGELDVVSEDLDAKLTKGMIITVTRIITDLVAAQEEIQYGSVTVETDQLIKGVTQVQTPGENGILTNYYSCVYEDGVEVSRSEEPVASEVTKEPVDEVILLGTLVQKPAKSTSESTDTGTVSSPGVSELALPASLSLDSNGIPQNYSKVISGRGVAYTASAGAKTSTGRTVKPGYVAVNPSVIPYGTELYIVASDGTVYGYAIAADTGGSCMANTILVDLFMNSTSECYAWGSKTVNIYVLS